MDHIALEIDVNDYEREHGRLEQLGLTVKTKTYDWGWRSLYISDPEGNTVEFVCFDASVIKSE